MLQTLADRTLGPVNFVIPLGVALSTCGCALSIQFSVTRLCYVAAREGDMLQALSYIHLRHLTPAPAVLLQVSSCPLAHCVGPQQFSKNRMISGN
jgi:amino acid transporter